MRLSVSRLESVGVRVCPAQSLSKSYVTRTASSRTKLQNTSQPYRTVLEPLKSPCVNSMRLARSTGHGSVRARPALAASAGSSGGGGSRTAGLGFRVQGLGFRVQEFRV